MHIYFVNSDVRFRLVLASADKLDRLSMVLR